MCLLLLPESLSNYFIKSNGLRCIQTLTSSAQRVLSSLSALRGSLPRQNTQLMLLEIFTSLLFHCKTLPSGPLFHLSGLVILIQLPLIHPALSFTCTFSRPGSVHILIPGTKHLNQMSCVWFRPVEIPNMSLGLSTEQYASLYTYGY